MTLIQVAQQPKALHLKGKSRSRPRPLLHEAQVNGRCTAASQITALVAKQVLLETWPIACRYTTMIAGTPVNVRQSGTFLLMNGDVRKRAVLSPLSCIKKHGGGQFKCKSGCKLCERRRQELRPQVCGVKVENGRRSNKMEEIAEQRGKLLELRERG